MTSTRARLSSLQFLDAGNVHQGAFHETFRYAIVIRVQADFDGVFADHCMVMTQHIETFPIAQMNAEGGEVFGV